MTLPEPRLLTAAEVAEYLQRSAVWVRQNAESLGAVKVGTLWRFDLADVKDAIRTKRNADLTQKRPDGLDILTPTPLSAKRRKAS